mmetsp:Transcript_38496/g.44856  ORF Transcript_38496/g.44856 Transcript_38496/m.44856 type:complete len:108 (-) Transcript_38496:29-352(-)
MNDGDDKIDKTNQHKIDDPPCNIILSVSELLNQKHFLPCSDSSNRKRSDLIGFHSSFSITSTRRKGNVNEDNESKKMTANDLSCFVTSPFSGPYVKKGATNSSLKLQ